MNNLDDINWKKQPANAPEGMYEQVRKRILQERLRMTQNHRQLVVGSTLLLVVGVVNIALIFLRNKEKQPISTPNTEKILYETYFDNTTNIYNAK